MSKIDRVKIWPIVALCAIRNRMSGAFRLWTFSRYLDHTGSGTVAQPDLFTYISHLGIQRRSLNRWLDSALKFGILRRVYRRRSKIVVFTLAGLSQAAITFGCTQIGKPVSIPANLIVGKGWRAWIWAAFLTLFKERPISRGKMCELTGVPEQTQRNYEHSIGITVIENFAVTDTSADHLNGVREFNRPYAFLFKDRYSNGEVIAYQLPNTYLPSKILKLMPKGRSRKNQKILNAASFFVERDQSIKTQRLYHDTSKSVKSTLRNSGRLDLLNRPEAVYRERFRGRSMTWEEFT